MTWGFPILHLFSKRILGSGNEKRCPVLLRYAILFDVAAGVTRSRELFL
jgi:hypothetical protein